MPQYSTRVPDYDKYFLKVYAATTLHINSVGIKRSIKKLSAQLIVVYTINRIYRYKLHVTNHRF